MTSPVVEELLGPLPNEWTYSTLGDACGQGGGSIQTGPFGSQLHASDYVEFGIPSIMPQNIGDNRVIEQGIARISEADANRLNRYLVASGDIVYSRRGDVERRAIIREKEDGWLCGTGCLRVRLGPNGPDPMFMSYYLGHPSVRAWIKRHAQGATMLNLNTSILSAVPVALPPRSQQRAIARILRAFDDCVDLNQAMNETLESLARAVFRSWFVDFDPVRTMREYGPPSLAFGSMSPLGDSFEESSIGLIPSGWQVASLGSVLAELETGSRPRGGVSGFEAGIPSIGAESIVGLGVFDYAKTKFVPQEFFERMSSGRVRDRDVLLYKDGGRPGEFEPHLTLVGNGFPFQTCVINEHVYRMRATNEIGQNFLFFWLTSELAMEEMRIKGTGVAIPGLNSTQVRSLSVLVPRHDWIRAFETLVEPWVSRILTNCRISRSVTLLRDLLLVPLLAGEMSAEKVAEAVR